MSADIEYRISNVNKLNIRSGPSTSSASIGTLSKGDKVECVGQNGSWTKIKYNGGFGYVYTIYLDASKNIMVVNTDSLKVRKGPSTSDEIILNIPKYTEVEVIPKIEGWSVVKYNGLLGFVSTEYLSDKSSEAKKATVEEITTIKKYVNTNELNFRKGPSTSDEVLGTISKNTEVDFISQANGWSKLKYNGTIGYVYSIYLSDKVSNIESTTNTLTLADKIIAYAKTLLGKPYVWGNEGPNSFDCSGFTWYVYKNTARITLPRVSSIQGTYGTYVEMKSLIPGDLVFFDTVGNYDKKITHVGIYIGNNEFIHASSGQGKVVISKLDGTYYGRVFVNGRRVLK